MSEIPAYTQLLRSERLDQGPFFTLINRTTRRLPVTLDGRQWVLEPGENHHIPAAVTAHAQRQHPRRGTFDITGQFGESLIAIKGVTPPAQSTLLPPGQEHLGPELFDRQANPHKRPVEIEEVAPARRIAEFDPSLDRAMSSDDISLTRR